MNRRPDAVFTVVVLSLGAVLLSLGVPVAVGQPEVPGTVRVVIAGEPASPTIDVVPPVQTICRNPRTDCAGEVRWVLAGRPLGADERVELQPKEGVAPCFAQLAFTLSPSAPEVASGQPTCAPGSAWDYDAVLSRGGEVVAVLDPRVVIDP